MVVQDGFPAGNSPDIRITITFYKFNIDGFGYFLRNTKRKGRPFPGIKPEKTHFFLLTQVKEIFVPGHIFGGREGRFIE
jgi:hypothetical protein